MALPNEPLTRTEQYLNRTATGGGTIPEFPLTRAEQYLNKIATGSGDTPEQPLTRMEQYLDYIAENGSGGVDPGDIVLRTLNVSQNGTTNAPDGVAYNKVVANVPNTYAAADEGKVVSNGALVAQTDSTTARNGVVDTTTIKQLTVNVPDGFPTDTASGAIASFPDGADDVPVKSLVAQIAPVQSGSGDPSPTNIRSISGWTRCGVSRTGKNLLQPFAQASATTNGVTLTNENGEYTLNGTATARASFDILANLPAGVYTLSANNDAIANGSVYVMSDANTVAENISLSSANKVQTFTVASRIERIRITVARDSVLTNVKLSLVITSGSTAATAYEPYQGDTYNITFPSEAGMVCGGTLDVTSGVLTVTKGLIPSYSGEAIPGEWISSMDVYAQGVTPTTGAQVCYDLASPITYQLDPVTVTTLLGVNSIWANTGDVEVEYYADVDLYVQKKSVTLDTLNATANGMYTPTTGHAYSSVHVAVPIPTYPIAENNSFGGGS